MENRVPGPGATQIHRKTPATHQHLCFVDPGHCSMRTNLTRCFAPGNGFNAVSRVQQKPSAVTSASELAGKCFPAELPVGSWQGETEMGMVQTQLSQLRG